jgi:preprotein translocase subunit Sec63
MAANLATYYDILRVPPQAGPGGVRTAYRSLAQRYHPDKLPGNPEAVQVMAMLNEAYDVLSDPDKRARYDQSIAHAQEMAASRSRPMPLPEVEDAAWPWYLLFATIAFAVISIGIVLYKMAVPSTVISVPAQARLQAHK